MRRWWKTCVALVVLGYALAPGQTTSVALRPQSQYILVDSSGKVRVGLENVQELHAYTIRVKFDPLVLSCRGVRGLQFFGSSGVLFTLIDSAQGTVQVDEALLGTGGRSGSGDLFEMVFVGVSAGTARLQFDNADLRDINNTKITVQTTDAEIVVGGPTGVEEARSLGASRMELSNYPNPFNLSTAIVIRGLASGPAVMRIYSILGEEVFRKEIAPAHDGMQTVVWEARDGSAKVVPTGVYVVNVEAGAFAWSRKIMLVK